MTVHDESVICVVQLKPECLDINSHVDEIFMELRQRDPGRYKMMTGGDGYICGLVSITEIVGSQVGSLNKKFSGCKIIYDCKSPHRW